MEFIIIIIIIIIIGGLVSTYKNNKNSRHYNVIKRSPLTAYSTFTFFSL